MNNFYISHSEKYFLGGRRRGREADGALSGYFVIVLALGLHCHRDGIWTTFIFLKKPQGI